MRTWSLQQFAAFPQEALPAVAADATSIRIDGVAFRLLIGPRLWPAIGFADVGVDFQRLQIVHRRSAVVALVGDDLLDHRHCLMRDGGDRFELLGGFGQRFLNGRRVALVGALLRDTDDRAGLQIDRVLGFMRQMRPTVLHLRDPRVRIIRMRPVVVRALVLAVSDRSAPSRHASASQCPTPWQDSSETPGSSRRCVAV